MASLLPERKGAKKKGLTVKLSAPKSAADPVARATTGNANALARIVAAGESDPTKKKGPSALERIFGVLDIPGVAVRTAIHDNTNQAGDKDLGIGKQVSKAWRGEKRVTGSEILDDWGVDNKWGRMLGGFLFDVVTDPVTYLSFGTGSVAKSGGMAAVGKLAAKGDLTLDALKGMGVADDVLKAVLPFADDTGKVVVDAMSGSKEGIEASRALMQGVYRALGDAGGVKFAGIPLGGQKSVAKAGYGLKDILRKVPGSEWAERAFGAGEMAPIVREGNEVMNAAIRVARRDLSGKLALGDRMATEFTKRLKEMVPDEAERMRVTVAIGRQLDDPENLDAIAVALREAGLDGDQLDNALELADAFRAKMGDILEAQRKAGVDISDLGEGYIPGATKFDRGKKESAAYDNILREMGFNPDELLDPAKPGQSSWRSTMKPKDSDRKKYINPEMRLLGITRDGEQTAKLSTELDLSRLGGKAVRDAERNVAFAQYQDDLANIVGDNDIAGELLSRTEAAFTNDEATRGFLKVYDKTLNTWKLMATSLNLPAFPARNSLSNKFLQWTEGLLDPTTEGRAAQVVMDAMKGTVAEADQELVERLVRNRVFTSAEEIAEIVGGRKPPKWIEKVGSVNEFVENQSRVAAFLAADKKLAAQVTGEARDAAAAALVDKALYSYDPAALTAFERNFMRRIMPFYVWMRRNTPHMVELLAKNPGKLTPVGHLKANADATNPVNEDVMPEWMRDVYPIPTPLKFGGQQLMVSTAGVLPVGDLEKLNLVREGKLDLRDILGSVSPLLKTPLELAFNRDIYYGDEVARYPGEKRRAPGYVERFDDLMDAVKLPGISDAWGMLKDAFGIEEREDAITGDPYLAMDAFAVKAMKDASPWMNNVGKLVADAPRTPYDRASYMTGVRVMPYDEERFERQKVFDDQSELQSLMSRLRDEGRLPDAPKKSKKKSSSLIPKRR